MAISLGSSNSNPGWQQQSPARREPRADVLCPAAHSKQRGFWKCGW
jgi:predicted SAM-dependent methyltransferase